MKGSVAVALGAVVLSLVAGCTDPSTSPPVPNVRGAAAVNGDPPPPPADGSPDPGAFTPPPPSCDTPEECDPTGIDLSPVIKARVQLNPGETAGFVDFFSTDPRYVVSPNARVRLAGEKVVGTGTIRFLFNSIPVVVDLSTATILFRYESTCFTIPERAAYLCPGDPGASNFAYVSARLSDLNGNPIVDDVIQAPRFVVYAGATFRYLFK